MATKTLNGVLQHVRLLAAVQTGRALSDQDLLARFVNQKDEAAFTVLIERHGPMVLGVCQRALKHAQDAEDACQATFLVFARKAGSLRKSASLSSWLHGIACRISANLKRQKARQRRREQQANVSQADIAANWQEAQTILDEELEQLADRYRAPLLLCYFEGKTRDEAAEQLGLTPGKLHGLLERGRALLRERLTRRGLTLSAALCASFLAAGPSHAALTPTLVVASTKAAMAMTASGSLPANLVSIQVMTLAKEVMRNMFVTKLKVVTASILCLGLAASLIGGSFATVGLAQDQKAKEKLAQSLPKTESDEAFIRRLSKDLRGVEPTPAEVHFFVHNNDAGKRQKLIDLFIQERHAKQQGDAGRALSLQAMARAQLELVGQLALIEQKKVEKVEPKAKPGWVDLDAKRRQLEAELKRLEAELDSLKAQAALSEKTRDLETTRLRLARTRVLEQLRTTQGTATNKVLKVELDRDSRGVVGLQDAFFRALIGAAKDKKEAVAITQEYLDSLMKYAKANPKANDAADAILQIELVYRALGKTVEADAWRDKLKKDYPTSPAWKHRQSSQPRINSLWLIEDAQLDEIEVYFALPARKEPPAKSR